MPFGAYVRAIKALQRLHCCCLLEAKKKFDVYRPVCEARCANCKDWQAILLASD